MDRAQKCYSHINIVKNLLILVTRVTSITTTLTRCVRLSTTSLMIVLRVGKAEIFLHSENIDETALLKDTMPDLSFKPFY
jgi:hypothetical protein